MYFSRHEFESEEQAAHEAARGVSVASELARRHFGISLELTDESVAIVDDLLARVRAMLTPFGLKRELAEPFARPFGCHVGEVLRRRYGGEWGVLRVFSDRVPALSLGPRGLAVLPTKPAFDQILGPTEGGVSAWFELVCRILEAPPSASPAEDEERPDRRYTLQPGQGYFDCGVAADGRQVVMSFFWDGLTALIFSPEGEFLRTEVRPLPQQPEAHPKTGRPLRSPGFEAAVDTALQEWTAELGLETQPVRVARFELPELGLGIEDRPGHFEEFLEAPELYEPDAEERAHIESEIRDWDRAGNFVLYWGNDLWLDGQGNVTSS